MTTVLDINDSPAIGLDPALRDLIEGYFSAVDFFNGTSGKIARSEADDDIIQDATVGLALKNILGMSVESSADALAVLSWLEREQCGIAGDDIEPNSDLGRARASMVKALRDYIADRS